MEATTTRMTIPLTTIPITMTIPDQRMSEVPKSWRIRSPNGSGPVTTALLSRDH
jgi:hypothetical protein